EFVHGFHQADVAFLNQVEELQPAVGIFFGDRDNETQVGFDQLALGGFSVNVALDDLALCALEFLVADAGVGFKLFQIVAVLALDTAIFALGLLYACSVDLLFQIVDLAIERAHGVNGLVNPLDEPLAFRIGEFQSANAGGNLDLCASESPAEL